MDSLLTYLLLALGGALGTVARYGFSMWAMPISQRLPFGTLLINMLGSLFMGFFGTLTLAGRQVSYLGTGASLHHGRSLWRLYDVLGVQPANA